MRERLRKAGQRPLCLSDPDFAKVSPVTLTLLTRQDLQSKKSFFRSRSQPARRWRSRAGWCTFVAERADTSSRSE